GACKGPATGGRVELQETLSASAALLLAVSELDRRAFAACMRERGYKQGFADSPAAVPSAGLVSVGAWRPATEELRHRAHDLFEFFDFAHQHLPRSRAVQTVEDDEHTVRQDTVVFCAAGKRPRAEALPRERRPPV